MFNRVQSSPGASLLPLGQTNASEPASGQTVDPFESFVDRALGQGRNSKDQLQGQSHADSSHLSRHGMAGSDESAMQTVAQEENPSNSQTGQSPRLNLEGEHTETGTVDKEPSLPAIKEGQKTEDSTASALQALSCATPTILLSSAAAILAPPSSPTAETTSTSTETAATPGRQTTGWSYSGTTAKAASETSASTLPPLSNPSAQAARATQETSLPETASPVAIEVGRNASRNGSDAVQAANQSSDGSPIASQPASTKAALQTRPTTLSTPSSQPSAQLVAASAQGEESSEATPVDSVLQLEPSSGISFPSLEAADARPAASLTALFPQDASAESGPAIVITAPASTTAQDAPVRQASETKNAASASATTSAWFSSSANLTATSVSVTATTPQPPAEPTSVAPALTSERFMDAPPSSEAAPSTQRPVPSAASQIQTVAVSNEPVESQTSASTDKSGVSATIPSFTNKPTAAEDTSNGEKTAPSAVSPTQSEVTDSALRLDSTPNPVLAGTGRVTEVSAATRTSPLPQAPGTINADTLSSNTQPAAINKDTSFQPAQESAPQTTQEPSLPQATFAQGQDVPGKSDTAEPPSPSVSTTSIEPNPEFSSPSSATPDAETTGFPSNSEENPVGKPQLAGNPDTVSRLGKKFQSVGTASAKEDASMKMAEETTKNADLKQQKLPGNEVTASEGQDLTPAAKPQAKSPAHGSSSEAATASVVSANLAHASATVTGASTNAPQQTDNRQLSLDRIHDLAAVHAIRVRQSGADSLRIVIQPGNGIQLSLELRAGDNGSIQAQALLNRGDYQFLSSHWADLQQRLEPQGIHLAPLECTSSFSGGASQNQSDGRSSQEEPRTGAFADFAFSSSMTKSPASTASRTKTHRGWETWA
jgi:hypothetical protein